MGCVLIGNKLRDRRERTRAGVTCHATFRLRLLIRIKLTEIYTFLMPAASPSFICARQDKNYLDFEPSVELISSNVKSASIEFVAVRGSSVFDLHHAYMQFNFNYEIPDKPTHRQTGRIHFPCGSPPFHLQCLNYFIL